MLIYLTMDDKIRLAQGLTVAIGVVKLLLRQSRQVRSGIVVVESVFPLIPNLI